jgi:chromosome segregation ATPase
MLRLQATHLELEKVKDHSDVKVHQLEAQLETQTGSLKRELAELEQKAADLGQQKVQLQQNNTKLVLTNLMLMNKAKQLEDNSRALVAKQEDLQHQVSNIHVAAGAAPAVRSRWLSWSHTPTALCC